MFTNAEIIYLLASITAHSDEGNFLDEAGFTRDSFDRHDELERKLKTLLDTQTTKEKIS